MAGFLFMVDKMATLRELIIKISANSSSFQSEIARASRMGNDYYRVMQNGGRQAALAAKESENALKDLTSGFATAGRAATAAAAAFATGELIKVADEWNSVNARLKQASQSSNDFAATQGKLMRISQSTGTAFSDNANLFARSAASMREFGYSSQEVLKVTEAISTGLKLSGANTQESSSVITQFSQALAQGVLRGEEFNAVNESGDRVIRALAAGMGVARKDLKAMADAGKLTIDQVVPAIISQLDTMQNEFAAMPQTVSSSIQRVSNSFMAWVGGVNEATGATDTLSGGINGIAGLLDSLSSSAVSGALNDVADNMSTITTAAGALVGVGLAKYFGGIVSGATSSTTSLIAAAKAEVSLASSTANAAQAAVTAARADVYRAQQALQRSKSVISLAAQEEKVAAAQSKVTLAQTKLNAALASGTATEKARAKAALDRAQAALVSAKNADAQALAEKRLAAAQAGLNRNLSNRSSAQQNLNNVTSVGTRMMSGALGLIGGIPGLVMLGAGAWYAMYQNQEQARKSAQEYARTIAEVRQATASMSLTDTSDSEQKTKASLQEQNRLVEQQAEKLAKLGNEIKGYRQMLADPGLTIGSYMVNHLTSIEDATKGLDAATSALATEQARLAMMQSKAAEIQSVLEGLEHRRVSLIRQEAAVQNSAYQSLLMMNGQHSEFNKLLSLGNNLLSARQGLVNFPMRIPNATLTDKQAELLKQSDQQLELAGLKGEARAKRQAEFAADAAGLTDTPEYAVSRNSYISNEVNRFRKDEASKPEKKGPKTEVEKTEDVYKRIIKQQQEQIALASQNTELAKVKFQIANGELSLLGRAQKNELIRNALALDSIKTQNEFKSLQEELLTPEEALLKKTRERVKLLKEASPASNVYKKTMERISKESLTSAPEFAGIDASVSGPSGELVKVADAEKELKKWYKKELENQQSLLDQKINNEQTYADRVADINKMNAERLREIQSGYTSASLSMFSDLASQSATLLQGIGQEGTAAYRMLFVASKAAAIAQAVINTELAATKAMAEGGLILGMPAATVIRAAGYASVGIIAGQTLAGMAHDGIDRVPETGTWLLQKGERVVTASTSAKLDATLESVQQRKHEERELNAGGFNFSPTIQVNGNPDDQTLLMIQNAVKQGAKQGYQLIVNSLSRGQGDAHKALVTGYQTKRRTG